MLGHVVIGGNSYASMKDAAWSSNGPSARRSLARQGFFGQGIIALVIDRSRLLAVMQ
jgi:hypothetical protein